MLSSKKVSRGISVKSLVGSPSQEKSLSETDRFYMKTALAEAGKAAERDEVPVGALVVYQGEVIGQAHNRREELHDPLAHAELLALQAASRRLGDWRLSGAALYVTLEPCIMCVGAILQARVSRVVFGCLDPRAGAIESLYHLCDDPRINPRPAVTSGVLAWECSGILNDFFARLRNRKVPAVNDQLSATGNGWNPKAEC